MLKLKETLNCLRLFRTYVFPPQLNSLFGFLEKAKIKRLPRLYALLNVRSQAAQISRNELSLHYRKISGN